MGRIRSRKELILLGRTMTLPPTLHQTKKRKQISA